MVFRMLAAMALTVIGLSAPAIALSQSYPVKPIRMVVPYTPGGGADSLARVIAVKMAEKLGQIVVIENKPGANTMLASEYVARQPADGYTLLYVASAFTINPSLYKQTFSVEKDFAPVALVAQVPLIIIANNNYPVRTLPELLAAARAQPGQLTYASYGQGSPAHLGGELLQSLTGVRMLHIPYKGSAPALTDLLGGQVNIAFSSIEPALQLIRADKVRSIAVMSAKRIAALPNVPAVAEFVAGFEAIGWNGIVLPAGTAPDIVQKLNAVINSTVQSADIRENFARQGVDVDVKSPESFGQMMKAEIVKWEAVVRKAGVKAE
jgi:tripartite-type tricarboxylate transporter receptor subunit TctC